jgi:hypothetical protein
MKTFTSTKGLVSTVFAVVLAAAGSLAAPAQAKSVWYEADLWGATASGTLNGKSFSNADVQLDFFGDTSGVQHYSVVNPSGGGRTSGYIILSSPSTSATFGIYVFDASTGSYTTVGTGTFESSAGIFVSVDNTNGGIGFGSFGVPPSHKGFPAPGQPVYPGAILVPACCISPNVSNYNLQTDLFVSAYQLGCWGFPGTCHTGKALATTAGPLVFNQITVGTGQFNAQVFQYAAVQPMNSLSATVAVHPLASGSTGASALKSVSVQATFQLGDGSESVDPATQDVVLRLGNQEFAIPAGSFGGSKETGYAFEGKIGGIPLRATLTPQSETDYSFQVEAAGVPAQSDRLAVRLTLGPAVGRTIVKSVER